MATTTKIDKRPSSLDSSRYSFTHLRYPDNITTDDSQRHYVGFYISVPEGTPTKLSGENTIGYVNTTGENSINTANANTNVITSVGAVAGGAAILSMGKKLGGLGANISTKTRLVGAGIGAATGGLIAANTFKKTEYMRISDAIILGMHNIPEVHYKAHWLSGEMGTLGGLMAGGSSAADAGMAATGTDLGKLAARNSLKIPGQAQSTKAGADRFGGFSDSQASATVNSITKEIANPFREQQFQNIEFRQFQFTYKFMPKSRDEAKAVKNIIEKFRFHMHPDLNATGVFLKFPSQFDIVYYFDGEVNTNLNKVATCVLTDFLVKYGSENDKFSSFKDGVPVETTITMVFKEISTLTKQQIKDGF
jgi:hypothetical protein